MAIFRASFHDPELIWQRVNGRKKIIFVNIIRPPADHYASATLHTELRHH